MITEIAIITVDAARAADFELAVAKAAPLFQAAEGCHGMALERVIERAGQYRLVVQWDSLDAHMTGFRNSADFSRWRALAGPFFQGPVDMVHSELAARYF